MNKKAQGLPMDTIIIAILILVVLVVIVAYFLGGFGQVGERISSIFNPHSAYSLAEAKTLCSTKCEKLNAVDDPESLLRSRFCGTSMTVDRDGDGKADKKDGITIKYYCDSVPSTTSVLGQQNTATDSLRVKCPYTTCSG